MINDGHHTTTLTLTRVIAARPAVVFRAWTEPELLARWWWPARFRTIYEVDLRPNGVWRFHTADLPDMGVLLVGGVFRKVSASEELMYTWIWEDADPGETLVTVEFRGQDDRTEVRVTHEGFADQGARDEHVQGWCDCLDRLVQAANAGVLTSTSAE